MFKKSALTSTEEKQTSIAAILNDDLKKKGEERLRSISQQIQTFDGKRLRFGCPVAQGICLMAWLLLRGVSGMSRFFKGLPEPVEVDTSGDGHRDWVWIKSSSNRQAAITAVTAVGHAGCHQF